MKLTLKDQQPVGFVAPAAPLMSVAFLLLMFALLDRRLVTAAQQADANLPRASSRAESSPARTPSALKVGLRADAAGNLTQVTLGSKNLGRDDAAFDRLSAEIRKRVGRSPSPLAEDVEVEIDADAGVHYQHVLRAVSACTGEIDPQTRSVVRAVEMVRFVPADPATLSTLTD